MDEAGSLHEALSSTFESLFTRLGRDSRVERRDGYMYLTCPILSFPQFNGVWADDDVASGGILESALAEIEGRGLYFSLQTRTGRSPNVEREAEHLGLALIDELPGMFATKEELADEGVPGFSIQPATDEAELAVAGEVAERGFGVPRGTLLPMYAPQSASLPGMSVYVGRAEGEPVATAVGWTIAGLVGIFGVSTVPEFRGRGLGGAMTARACLDGFEAGAEGAWLQSSAMGEPVYRRLGFREVVRYKLFGRPAGG